MSRPRKPAALYTALSVSIDCPGCGESQPSPNDSLFWTAEELSLAIEENPHRVCGACDLSFVLRQQNKVGIYLGAAPRAAQTPTAAPVIVECPTCLGVGRIRDGETRDLRKCLDCNGTSTQSKDPVAPHTSTDRLDPGAA